MKLEGKVVVVTGAARGIGRAMAERFHAERPKALVVADLDAAGAAAVAQPLKALAVGCDVSSENSIASLIARTEAELGPIDLFCSNAGTGSGLGLDAPDEKWQQLWQLNVMSQVWAARHLVPKMLSRGGGYLLNTASAAGLLSMVGDAPYSVSKHASVAFSEWLSITYGQQGLKVSCLCPLFVNTDLLKGALRLAGGRTVVQTGVVLEPTQVAQAVVEALDAERFLILPHPEVATYVQNKANDPERWLKSMRKLWAAR
jgi:NAD(P)-dependent dehydrogenase (short-subunit alcohol dehydrogenase family)